MGTVGLCVLQEQRGDAFVQIFVGIGGVKAGADSKISVNGSYWQQAPVKFDIKMFPEGVYVDVYASEPLFNTSVFLTLKQFPHGT